MPFVVVYDASVLYPSTLRDLLIRVTQSGLVQARWTEEILDEMFAALKRDRPDLDPVRLRATQPCFLVTRGERAISDSLLRRTVHPHWGIRLSRSEHLQQRIDSIHAAQQQRARHRRVAQPRRDGPPGTSTACPTRSRQRGGRCHPAQRTQNTQHRFAVENERTANALGVSRAPSGSLGRSVSRTKSWLAPAASQVPSGMHL
jgi:hypothetical protein